MKPTMPQQNDVDLRKNFYFDTLVALGFFTRLPLGAANSARPLASAVSGFAPAGFLIGLAAGAVATAALALGLPTYLAVVVSIVFSITLTGALHEDGLADTADGFAGGWQRADKLRIMRDSHIGTYGTLSLVMAVLLRAGGYYAVLANDASAMHNLLVFAAIGGASRSFFGLMMMQMDRARDDGLAVASGKPGRRAAHQALIIGLGATLILVWLASGLPAALAVILAAAASYFVLKRLARRHIGGVTGDVIGALQQTSEIACLLALVVVAA